jgi:hypothetical protein
METAGYVYAMPESTTSYRYLTKLPGVRSGRTIIEGTRIGVQTSWGWWSTARAWTRYAAASRA